MGEKLSVQPCDTVGTEGQYRESKIFIFNDNNILKYSNFLKCIKKGEIIMEKIINFFALDPHKICRALSTVFKLIAGLGAAIAGIIGIIKGVKFFKKKKVKKKKKAKFAF